MLAGIREVLVVTSVRDRQQFEDLLGDGQHLGLDIKYVTQDKPRGIAHGLALGEDFSQNEPVALILGDNIFYGAGVGDSLRGYGSDSGATVFAQRVKNPSRYGVIEIKPDGTPISIEEKPTHPKSNMAVTGLYFYDNTVFERAKLLAPSARGELEVTDLNLSYLASGDLRVVSLPRGTAWLDTGTFESLAEAGEFVRVIETRQDFMVSCPEEIAWRRGYITSTQLLELASEYGAGRYAQYLKKLVSE